jgi:endonuclease G
MTFQPPRMQDMVSLGQLAGRRHTAAMEASATGTEAIRTNHPEHFQGRSGYSARFLDDFDIPLPAVVGKYKGDEVPLLDGSGHALHYTNFSLVMSKLRRMSLYTACNIDGERSKKIRRSKDTWFFDGRIDIRHQVGDELYAENDLDRGHLVRREDPVWGDDAAIANDDTFHFTNCSPQHSGMNQQTWLGLENYILNNTRVHSLKVTVFTGPVLADDDMVYRGVQIPKEYWKIVAIRAEGRPSATAYMISQDRLIRDLEFVFGRYKTYQVSIRHVEGLAGLSFGQLSQYDGFSNEERATGVPQRVWLDSWATIRV